MNRALSNLEWAIVLVVFVVAPETYSTSVRPLRVSFGKVRVNYCAADPELVLATVRVNVTFVNQGNKVVILSRKFGPDENLRLTDLSGNPVYSPNITNYETKIPQFGRSPNENLFELIRPGASAHREFITGFHFSKDPEHRVDSTPVPGDYRLWVTHSTWPVYGDEAGARRAQEQWHRYGVLVIRRIRLPGIRLHISLPPTLPACDGPDAGGT